MPRARSSTARRDRTASAAVRHSVAQTPHHARDPLELVANLLGAFVITEHQHRSDARGGDAPMHPTLHGGIVQMPFQLFCAVRCGVLLQDAGTNAPRDSVALRRLDCLQGYADRIARIGQHNFGARLKDRLDPAQRSEITVPRRRLLQTGVRWGCRARAMSARVTFRVNRLLA